MWKLIALGAALLFSTSAFAQTNTCVPITNVFQGNCTSVVTAPPAVNGKCGTANGTTVPTVPTTNLCATGAASTVMGSGPWGWNCNGSNGGTNAACSALLATVTPPPGNNPCGMQLGSTAPIFCDTFSTQNSGTPSRTGALDPNVWGVSRATGFINLGQSWYNPWTVATQMQNCSGATITVQPPGDILICNGVLREATNDNPSGVFDNGGVTVLAMYPKQPFDFAGRTGTISFDVSNDSHGNHSVWPELWMTDAPVPAPFNHFDSWQALPQNGFGISFAAAVIPGQVGECPNSNNLASSRWTVDRAVVIRNYVMEDIDLGTQATFGTPSNPPLKVVQTDCVISPADGSGVMNHIEVRVNQTELDVYATDAGVAPTPTSLRKIAVITNANLSFTRGLVWLEDAHYNADKENLALGTPSQRNHTFFWDNLAFDGPFPGRDFAYDALDALQPTPGYTSTMINLGKEANAGLTTSWNVLGLPANRQATAVKVLFNFTNEFSPTSNTLNVIVNGHAHPTPWPYPDKLTNTWRTFAVTIPITDLVTGTNVVQIGSDQPIIVANVDIVLAGVPGGVPVLPGSNNAYPQ